MDKNLIEQYKNEMLRMYQSRGASPAIPTQVPPMPESAMPTNPQPEPPVQTPPPSPNEGRLTAIVTSLRAIYPVVGAKVTVFTGNIEDMTVIDTALTDESGKTKSFVLPAPDRILSQTSGASDKPYASYNMLVQADGYIDNIHLNIPVFSGTNSLQASNLMLSETAGENKGPQIFDESQQFSL